MHVFPYSKRTGTPAARMEDQIDEEVKHARVHELIELSERMQLAYAKKFVGQVLELFRNATRREYPVKGRSQASAITTYKFASKAQMTSSVNCAASK